MARAAGIDLVVRNNCSEEKTGPRLSGCSESETNLSDRENEIALLVLEGLCDKEIGVRLCPSTLRHTGDEGGRGGKGWEPLLPRMIPCSLKALEGTRPVARRVVVPFEEGLPEGRALLGQF